MTQRTKAIVGSVVTVVVVAVAIFIGWSLSSPKKPTTPPTIQLSPAQQSDQAFQDAMRALSSEETSTAVALLQKALTLNPDNSAAKTQLDQINSASDQASKPTTTTAKPKPAVDPWAAQIKSLKTILPTKFTDYSVSGLAIFGKDGTISGTSEQPNPAATTVLWAVHNRNTVSAAQKFIDDTSKTIYSHDQGPITINGVTGVYGTDGSLLSWAAYRRGRYVFEVTLTSSNGNPSSLRSLTESAAAAFPTKP